MEHLAGAKIKHLQTIIKKAKLEKEQLAKENKLLKNKIDKNNSLIKKHQQELDELIASSGTLLVSEHAILRYLQRTYKLDLSKIEKEIMTPKLLQQVKDLGNGTYHNGDIRIKVIDNIVVTILEQKKDL